MSDNFAKSFDKALEHAKKEADAMPSAKVVKRLEDFVQFMQDRGCAVEISEEVITDYKVVSLTRSDENKMGCYIAFWIKDEENPYLEFQKFNYENKSEYNDFCARLRSIYGDHFVSEEKEDRDTYVQHTLKNISDIDPILANWALAVFDHRALQKKPAEPSP